MKKYIKPFIYVHDTCEEPVLGNNSLSIQISPDELPPESFESKQAQAFDYWEDDCEGEWGDLWSDNGDLG